MKPPSSETLDNIGQLLPEVSVGAGHISTGATNVAELPPKILRSSNNLTRNVL